MNAVGVFDVSSIGALTETMSNEGPGITRSLRHVPPCHSQSGRMVVGASILGLEVKLQESSA